MGEKETMSAASMADDSGVGAGALRQTPKRDFGDRMKAGIETAADGSGETRKATSGLKDTLKTQV